MKPSEYFFKERINNQRWFDEYDSDRHAILDLDKRFIDKEELKSKIHKNSKCLNIDTEYYNGYRDAVNNILKLLESEDK